MRQSRDSIETGDPLQQMLGKAIVGFILFAVFIYLLPVVCYIFGVELY